MARAAFASVAPASHSLSSPASLLAANRIIPPFSLDTAKGGDPELVRASERRRFAKDTDRVDRVLALDSEYREG